MPPIHLNTKSNHPQGGEAKTEERKAAAEVEEDDDDDNEHDNDENAASPPTTTSTPAPNMLGLAGDVTTSTLKMVKKTTR